MHFHYGLPPETNTPSEDWTPLKEPSAAEFMIAVKPLAFSLMALFAAMWSIRFYFLEFESTISWLRVFIFILTSFPLVIAVHELIHYACFPAHDLSSKTTRCLGFCKDPLIFYAYSDGEMSRNRFLVVLVAPIFLLSLVPWLMTFFIHFSATSYIIIATISSWNAMSSCGDLFGSYLVYQQVPSKGKVRNNGWKTYWQTA